MTKTLKNLPLGYLRPAGVCVCVRHVEQHFSPGPGHVSAGGGIVVAISDMVSYLRP